jgi:hypothetical protein
VTELEQALTRLGRELDYPQTPALAPRVRSRLERPQPKSRRLLPAAGFRRALAIALVGLLVLAGGVFAAVPSVRDAVLEFFGLQGATVERRERLPAAPAPEPLSLGRATTLAQATRILGFTPLVPSDPGTPDGVYVRRDIPGGELALAYRAGPGLPETRTTGLGLLVTEFRGDLQPELIGKLAGTASAIEELTLDGERAVWIEGAEHFFFYRRPDGQTSERELRLAANVLLLEQGNMLVRLEGSFDFPRAEEIARSLEPES